MTLAEIIMKSLGYNIPEALEIILKTQSLPQYKLLQWQNDKKWMMVKYHFTNNPFYYKKLRKKIPKNWNELPIMEKSDYQISFNEILSTGFSKKNTYIANTSGSSGHPFYYAKNKDAHALTWALTINRYDWHKINLSSKEARFYGMPLDKKNRYFELCKDFFFNRKRFNVFDLSDENLNRYLFFFKENKFNYIYGYTNSLVLFARFLIKRKKILKEICPSINLCIITSELLTSENRFLLSKGFGTLIINEYGISEAGGITAFQDKNMNWKLSTESQYLEIVDDNNNLVPVGNDGNILITDLYNKAMPFIRYKVGDIGRLIKKDNTFYLDHLIGRINDTIRLPNGKKSPGLTFYYISKSTLEKTGIIKEFIVRQTKIDTFIFEIVSDRDLTKNEIKQIKKDLDLYLEPGLKLIINRTSKIIREKSGKTKHFYSELNE